MPHHATGRSALRGTIALLSFAALPVLGTACQGSGSATQSDNDGGTVELVGERAGLLVWRKFSGATVYKLEVLLPNGATEFSLNTADTVGGFPPRFEGGEGKTWWVRAYDANRQIAASEKARVY
jgi:hypothetical protein